MKDSFTILKDAEKYLNNTVTYEDLAEAWYKIGADLHGLEFNKLIEALESQCYDPMVKLPEDSMVVSTNIGDAYVVRGNWFKLGNTGFGIKLNDNSEITKWRKKQ